MQDNAEKQALVDSPDTQFPLVDYLDAHSGWKIILPDVIKTAAKEERSIYSKKMKEKIGKDYKSKESLYTSLAAKIKSGGMYIGMLSGIGASKLSPISGSVETGGGGVDDCSNVMLGTAYSTLLGFDKPQ
jgi:hypothetical protein